MPVASNPPDPRSCPLCGQPNRCAMEMARSTGLPQPPCWCLAVHIPAATLAAIPAQARNLACICSACAAPAPAS
ncbi:cysteine-rich CWC family protein [Rhodoferax sp.]|uniref:cysteine-rich CWC family protein n=1 Tax=Rhodoferax sp. TaxID=50421 RepID=UPI0025DEA91B|nr:cysteine-rich CWC family protein [Rhodoferax sp.]